MMKIFKFSTLFVLLLVINSCKKDDHGPDTSHWDYEHAADWGTTGYPDCGGIIQSPVNIEVANTVLAAGLPAVVFNYSNFNMKIIDNGHTLQVNNNGTNSITYQGKTYNFLQFHFHAHSEHTINGSSTPLELHMVHSDPTSGALLVTGLFISSGTANTLLDKVLTNWPATKEQESTTTTSINLNDLLPVNRNYFTYVGSLTTPPCSQGVTFVLYKENITMSAAQIASFTNKYSHNYRPVQPLNSRIVYSTN